MNDEGAPNDSGFDDSGPFADTPPAGGVTLESALREFGPAALDDLIPRLRSLAADLDEAHAAGFVHGRLHSSRIIVTDDATYLMGRRVPASGTSTPAADQAAFAAIAYEWMLGRRVSPGAAVTPSPPPGVDRAALTHAFVRALSMERDRQFDSIGDFVIALEGSQTLVLPLAADNEDDPVEPFIPETPESTAAVVAGDALIKDVPPARDPDFDTIDREFAVPMSATSATGASGATKEKLAAGPTVTSAYEPPRRESQRFGGLALMLAAIVGAVFGFAAGYMAKPRALQTAPPSAGATDAIAEEARPPGNSIGPAAGNRKPAAPASRVPDPGPPAPAPVAPAKIGRLLVRSTPSGASVSVNGVARGVTPLALRDLDLGSHSITVAQRGYEPEERRIALTTARPSRSVEVRLSSAATAGRSGATPSGPPRPSTPASFGKPAATTGVLAIESQPPGASVTVNGKPSGTTPTTINDLAPGEYRVTMTLQGFQEFATTVRVVAGERARAAARLTEQEQE